MPISIMQRMAGQFTIALAIIAVMDATAPCQDRDKRPDWQLSGNLIPNGEFEKGDRQPDNWQGLDGLSTFWIPEGRDGGRCVMIDTDVLLTQWQERQKEIERDPDSKASARLPTKPPKYDTVAGNDGVHYKSLAHVTYREGAVYLLSVDCRTSAQKNATFTPFMWCRGYLTHRGRERRIGEAQLYLHDAGPEWKTHCMLMHPSKWKSTINDKPAQPEYFKVVLYAYWPPGKYWFDNVSLVEVDETRLPPELKKMTAQPQRPPEPPGKSRK
ncbi:MAG TPA: hypothetical protein PL033_17480 [Candidatus Brocadiia bacterium]|nr:hypothetical protein [Candidatus Brocadiia bacterium]